VTTSETQPLLDRESDDCIASITTRVGSKNCPPYTVRVSEFLGHVNALAAVLPERSHAINMCGNRYRFLVAFAAVIVRGQCNLLPANKNQATQNNLAKRYADSYVIHDGIEPAPGIQSFEFREVQSGEADVTHLPAIPLNQLSAISFTSGSTGQSKANVKTWRTLYYGMHVNSRYYLDDRRVAQSPLATVPAQHMYGLETSIMMPLSANVCVADENPLFPEDIRGALARMSVPRILVTTPVHIQALENSKLKFPEVELILCATAFLEPTMAKRIESRLGGRLREFYGCSEVGTIARRDTAQSDEWEAFDIFHFNRSESRVVVGANHLPEETELQDILEFSSDRCFRLLGRNEDMINIAGKRGSLSELNRLLLTTPGVIDGVIFEPPTDDTTGRLAALVVAPELSSREAMANIRANVDPVFVPRRVVFVESLPRSETGKLPREQILARYKTTV
jgi:acyl-coenzyme A synthetase/AMP-(fatty) acid ligase